MSSEHQNNNDGENDVTEKLHRIYIWGASGALFVGFFQYLAATLEKTKNLLAVSTPFSGMVTPQNDGYDWVVWVGAYFAMLSTISGASAALWLLFRDVRWLSTGKWWSFGRLYDTIGNCYADRRYSSLLRLQFAMRMLFVTAVIVSALTSIGHRNVPNSADSIGWVVVLHVAQICLGSAYMIFAMCRHFYNAALTGRLHKAFVNACNDAAGDAQKMRAAEIESDAKASTIFWQDALQDYFVITFIWCTTVLPDREYYLAYLLPLMGVWLVIKKGQSKKIFFYIVCAVLIRTAIVGSLRVFNPELNRSLAILEGDRIWIYAGQLVPKIAFFGGITVLIATLRHVHSKLQSRIVEQHGTLTAAQENTRQVVTELHTLREQQEKLKNELHSSSTKIGLLGESVRAATAEIEKQNKAVESALSLAEMHSKELQAEKAYFKEEHLVKSALVNLGVSQSHAVFIKDVHRRFIFANDVFLELITPTLQTNVLRQSSSPVKLVEIPKGSSAKFEDIRGRSDAELGIDLDDYRISDQRVLGLDQSEIIDERVVKHDKTTDHFEGAEHSFEQPDGSSCQFWTIKQALRDDRDSTKVWGLVGEVLNGEQEVARRLSEQLVRDMPLYVSMKDEEGYVVLLNQSLLEALKNTILKDAPDKTISPVVHMRKMNAGRGPLDKDLYDSELADEYKRMDDAIRAAAEDYIRNQHRIESAPAGTISEDDRRRWSLQEVLRRIELITQKGVHDYPNQGWIEFHRFPDEPSGKWVEVRKFPVIQETKQGTQTIREYRGTLVVFQDVTQMYLRRCIVWHWLSEHFQPAREASANFLAPDEKNGVSENLEAPESLPLIRLFQTMLLWTRQVIDKVPLLSENQPHTIKELKLLMKLLEARYRHQVKIDTSGLPSDLVIPVNGYKLFAVIVVLAMNAVEARLATRHVGRQHPLKICMSCTQEDNELVLNSSVIDEDDGFDKETSHRINARQQLRRSHPGSNELPGGGLILADGLAEDMGGARVILSSDGVGRGSKAEISIPLGKLNINLTKAKKAFGIPTA